MSSGTKVDIAGHHDPEHFLQRMKQSCPDFDIWREGNEVYVKPKEDRYIPLSHEISTKDFIRTQAKVEKSERRDVHPACVDHCC